MKRPHVVLVDPIHEVGTKALDGHADWHVSTSATRDELMLEMADAAGVIVRARLGVDAAVMDAAPNLLVVGKHGVGVDNIDLSAATDRGIWVVNTPEANAEAVAEHTYGMILALARNLHVSDRAVRADDWDMRNRLPGFEVLGLTLGIVGIGRIGARVAEIGVRAFSQRVLYTDVVARPDLELALGIERAPLDRLLAESDIVTVHTPATPATVGMFDREQFAQMKKGAIFVNASRGKVVVESALYDGLESGHLRGAGVDVFETEPPSRDLPLLARDDVMVSPHKAGMSEPSMQRMSLVTEDIVRILNGEEPKFAVNKPPKPRG